MIVHNYIKLLLYKLNHFKYIDPFLQLLEVIKAKDISGRHYLSKKLKKKYRIIGRIN